ncbi:MAG TPA: hypothetical protein PKI03_36135, partial [Pseudomonadota bacterium]|nr:hypothetical protein [Pseudomonadota bacterium]
AGTWRAIFASSWLTDLGSRRARRWAQLHCVDGAGELRPTAGPQPGDWLSEPRKPPAMHVNRYPPVSLCDYNY